MSIEMYEWLVTVVAVHPLRSLAFNSYQNREIFGLRHGIFRPGALCDGHHTVPPLSDTYGHIHPQKEHNGACFRIVVNFTDICPCHCRRDSRRCRQAERT